ncbi:MAG: hypothetical protein HYT16_01325 [DPANN group archaeon]|nr:hypothetical protein [DPANN group archaeon]
MPSGLTYDHSILVNQLAYEVLTTLRDVRDESLAPQDIARYTGREVLAIKNILTHLRGESTLPPTAGVAVRLSASGLVAELADGRFALTHRGKKIASDLTKLVKMSLAF